MRTPAERSLLGVKDIFEKTLEDYDDVFADIINGFFFNGDKVVDPGGLTDLHPVSHYGRPEKEGKYLERDVFKKWKQNTLGIAMIGIENQSSADKMMPIRNFGYDGSAYRRQMSEYEAGVRLWKRSLKRNQTKDQKPVFRPLPVITLVLYFGKNRWEKNRYLSELLEIPDNLRPFVNDYKINVFEISWLSDEEISRFRSDFRIVANFFSKMRKYPDYEPDDKTEMIHPDEVLNLIASVTGDNRYLIIKKQQEERKVRNMCEVAERLINKGRKEGREEGREEGETLMASLIDKLIRLGRSTDISKAVSDKSYRDKLYTQFGMK